MITGWTKWRHGGVVFAVSSPWFVNHAVMSTPVLLLVSWWLRSYVPLWLLDVLLKCNSISGLILPSFSLFQASIFNSLAPSLNSQAHCLPLQPPPFLLVSWLDKSRLFVVARSPYNGIITWHSGDTACLRCMWTDWPSGVLRHDIEVTVSEC